MVFACISDVTEPRALAQIFEKAETRLASKLHPDPYIRESPRLRYVTSSKKFISCSSFDARRNKVVCGEPLFSYRSFVEFKTHAGNAIYPYVTYFAFVPLS
jgi:hypothetical protein